jgi:hypothetical protein
VRLNTPGADGILVPLLLWVVGTRAALEAWERMEWNAYRETLSSNDKQDVSGRETECTENRKLTGV